jgi:(2R)-3-sulfolactate dehydrogenase (NADP+)
MVRVSLERARAIATAACLAAGADGATTSALVEATLSAAQSGRTELGFPHLLDYLAALRAGRIKGDARPRIAYPVPGVIDSDAMGGIAQLGFDLAFDELCRRARSLGIALFTQRNSFTAGELGYYVRRLACQGLVGWAVANGPALMAAAPGQAAVYCTNPMAFGVAMPEGAEPFIIDQASSATAFLSLRKAAAEARAIPEGWAIDRCGRPTTEASAALDGALLPFGGYKGANLALLVELLSAGLSSAAWSLDAPRFDSGERSLNCGLTVIATAPLDAHLSTRVAAQLQRLQAHGVRLPGQRSSAAAAADSDSVSVPEALLGPWHEPPQAPSERRGAPS